MAFILNGATVVSYADSLDVKDKDQRLFEANEINFTDVPDAPQNLDQYIEDLTTKATARINNKIRASGEWHSYLGYTGSSVSPTSIPVFDGARIKSRKSDFTDMCAYYTLKEYILPKIADFGNPESPEVQKIQYYDNKFNDLFSELLNMMDWYDADADGIVQSDETAFRTSRTRRSRSRSSVTKVR